MPANPDKRPCTYEQIRLMNLTLQGLSAIARLLAVQHQLGNGDLFDWAVEQALDELSEEGHPAMISSCHPLSTAHRPLSSAPRVSRVDPRCNSPPKRQNKDFNRFSVSGGELNLKNFFRLGMQYAGSVRQARASPPG